MATTSCLGFWLPSRSQTAYHYRALLPWKNAMPTVWKVGSRFIARKSQLQINALRDEPLLLDWKTDIDIPPRAKAQLQSFLTARHWLCSQCSQRSKFNVSCLPMPVSDCNVLLKDWSTRTCHLRRPWICPRCNSIINVLRQLGQWAELAPWTSPASVDIFQLPVRSCSNASGLSWSRWLCLRTRL